MVDAIVLCLEYMKGFQVNPEILELCANIVMQIRESNERSCICERLNWKALRQTSVGMGGKCQDALHTFIRP